MRKCRAFVVCRISQRSVKINCTFNGDLTANYTVKNDLKPIIVTEVFCLEMKLDRKC